MASIFERKDKDGKIRYRVQVRLKGYPPQSETFDRKTDAKKWVQDIESAIREGRHFKTAQAKRHTLGELIDRYIREVLPRKPKSERKQRAQLLWWKQEIGHCLLADVTSVLLAEKRDKLAQGKTKSGSSRSPSTVTRYLAVLSHSLSVASREWLWIDDSPMRKVIKPPQPRGRVRFLLEDERKNLLDVCKRSRAHFLYIAVVISISAGLRQAELMNLKWPDVDLEKGRIILEWTKNGDRRTVPIAGLALQLLRELDRKRRIDTLLIFPGRNPQKPINLRCAWQKALRESAIKNFRWHDLRHCCASYLAMNGASLTEIAEILGHRSISITRKYSHLSDSHTAGVVANMNEKIFALEG